jgi:hypothetical protein
MNKVVTAQTFDNAIIINYIRRANEASLLGDARTIDQMKSLIDSIFKQFDLTKGKNVKLQLYKNRIDTHFINITNKAIQRTESVRQIPEDYRLPFGGDFDAFANALITKAKAVEPNNIKQALSLLLNTEHYDFLLRYPKETNQLFNILKDKYQVDMFEPLLKNKPMASNADKPRLSNRDKVLQAIKDAHEAANAGELQKVQILQGEVDKIFGLQFDMLTGRNPKLKEMYDRILKEFKSMKDLAAKIEKNPNYKKPGYKLPYSNEDDIVKFATEIVNKAKASIQNPNNLLDLRNRIEIIIQTGHADLLNNPLLKNDLYRNIEKITTINLDKPPAEKPPVKALNKLNKIIISFEDNNLINESIELEKIFIKLANSIIGRNN